MSYWEHRKPVQRVRAIDEHGIARAAVDLLDEGGLRALTVRAVAGKLGVAAASLYSRVDCIDDLFDLALDEALAGDQEMDTAVAESPLLELMLSYFHHLVRHRWACQVIGMRAPRGPAYLRLSERMVVLLSEAGADDPLGAAYTLSNFVIGSATTAAMSGNERSALVNPEIAPNYASLHSDHTVEPETIVTAGLTALIAQVTSKESQRARG